MLEFKPVTKQEAPRLRRYYQTCEFGLCEYSVGTKLMWKAALPGLGGDCRMPGGPQ